MTLPADVLAKIEEMADPRRHFDRLEIEACRRHSREMAEFMLARRDEEREAVEALYVQLCSFGFMEIGESLVMLNVDGRLPTQEEFVNAVYALVATAREALGEGNS